MDDRHIEESLRECWTPNPPEGMKDRVLRAARQEVARPRPSRWKVALAAAGVLVILLTNASDHARQMRIAAMVDGVRTPAREDFNLRDRKNLIGELLARGSADSGTQTTQRKGDQL